MAASEVQKVKEFEEEVVEDELSRDEEEVLPLKYAISSYGADYTVDGLVNRLRKGDIFIPPFQRGYVWRLSDASGFIESLLLGLPVPGVFLSKEPETQKLLVIDGQQRLKSLEFFYEGIFGPTSREFALQGVQEEFKGKTYKTLSDEDRRRLDDSIIHATIIRQESPKDDESNSSVFYIFERLNSGGRRLSDQEIRSAIYSGPFNELLEELNQYGDWRKVFGKEHDRSKDCELILRFLALYHRFEEYKPPMKEFLNRFMSGNRTLKYRSPQEFKTIFLKTIEAAYKSLGEKAFRPESQINAAVFDAVMVGLAKRLEKGEIADFEAVKSRYEELLKNPDFQAAYERATADETKVRNRINSAIQAFSNVR